MRKKNGWDDSRIWKGVRGGKRTRNKERRERERERKKTEQERDRENKNKWVRENGCVVLWKRERKRQTQREREREREGVKVCFWRHMFETLIEFYSWLFIATTFWPEPKLPLSLKAFYWGNNPCLLVVNIFLRERTARTVIKSNSLSYQCFYWRLVSYWFIFDIPFEFDQS